MLWLAVALGWLSRSFALPAQAGQALEDNFERQALAGGPVAWQAKGTWAVENGRLVNRSKSRDKWPNEMVWVRASRPVPVGGLVCVDAVHDGVHRTPGYLSLLARDSDSKAYAEWVSHRHTMLAGYRTSATDPAFKSPPKPCLWTAAQFATYTIRWKGYDEKTKTGTVELVYTPKAGADPDQSIAFSVEVVGLRKLDQVELVVNGEDQAGTAQTAAFDNFRIDLSEGPDLPAGFAAAPTPGGGVRVAWNVVADAEAYVLQRAAGPDGGWAELARPPGDASSYEDGQAQPSVLYRYRLRAENKKGASSWSASAEAIVPGPPLAPSDLKALVRRDGLLLVEWRDNAVNEKQFVVERQAEAAWETLHISQANLPTIEDWAPVAGTVRYRVRAVNEQGASAWSNVAEARPPKPSPALLSPAERVVFHRQKDLPAASVELVFDQPVKPGNGPPAADFAISAHRHPWHAGLGGATAGLSSRAGESETPEHGRTSRPWHGGPLPKPEITAVTYQDEGRKARLAFSPAIPDLTEYRITVQPSLTGADGVPVAAPLIRLAALLGDEDRDGFVAPAPGQRLGKRLPMPPMPIGIMAEDIEWNTENGAHNVEYIIELMDAYKGIDFFRVNLWWDSLEPEEGQFDPKYVGFLRRVLAAAEAKQLPLEIGLRQVRWPLWVCNHKGFDPRIYEPRIAPKLADTWRRLAALCHEYPVVFAYWPISEEYPGPGELRNYLACMELAAKTLRTVHPGCVVKLRPAASPFHGGYEVTPTVSQRGPQDICMAAGIYPTGWQWDIPNPTPLSASSFTNMVAFRYYASEAQGGPNGVGEIGFRAAAGAKFGDAERLLAFERCLTLAYDVGLLEYVIWGESWTFSDPATYFPRLAAFRDLLMRQPRHSGFDLRLVHDPKASFAHPPYSREIELDLSPVFRWLEERGVRFFLTTPAADPLQKAEAKASVKISDLLKFEGDQQFAFLYKALAGIEPTGVVLPWLDRTSCRQSLTGLPCHVEIEFPGARGLCDAVSLSPTRLQLYAPPATLVRWRHRGPAGDWHDLVTATDSRITILDISNR